MNQKLAYGKLNTSGGLSTSYTATLMWIIHAALHFAVQEQYCPPVKYTISKLQKTDQEQIVLSREEQAAFEKKLILNPTPTKMGILLSLNTGLRIGEVCALQWDDLDFKNNILHAKNVVRDQLAKASAKSRINKLTGRLAEKTSEFWKTSGKYTLNKVVVGLYSIVEGEVYKRKLKKWVTGEMDEYYHCELAA